MYSFSGSVCHLAQEHDLQSESDIKEIVLGIVFNIRKAYRCNNWKLIACLLRNHQFKKRVHLGKQLECQLANEDDLRSKSVIKNCF